MIKSTVQKVRNDGEISTAFEGGRNDSREFNVVDIYLSTEISCLQTESYKSKTSLHGSFYLGVCSGNQIVSCKSYRAGNSCTTTPVPFLPISAERERVKIAGLIPLKRLPFLSIFMEIDFKKPFENIDYELQRIFFLHFMIFIFHQCSSAAELYSLYWLLAKRLYKLKEL